MTISSPLQQNFITDTWVKTTWEEFIELAYAPAYQNGRAYYNRGQTRIEMTPIGWNHAEDNSIISTLVILFCAIKQIPVKELTNCSFRKTGIQEAQPDIAFYINSLTNIPSRSNSPVDLDRYSPPTLVVEIASSSLSDDLGEKRLLYEQMNVQEYWVVAVNRGEITAFAIADSGSKSIQSSQVLPGLTVKFIQDTLKRSLSEDHGAVTRWILNQLQSS
jgi:Uma2 family endonuclease